MTDRANDKILIRDLLLRGIIGLNEWEREKKQDILINLTIFADLGRAGATDDVQHTLNYRSITKAVIRLVESTSYYLVEALGAEIARVAIVDFGARRVVVRVEKPGALRFANSVGIEIDRCRADFADTADFE
ncbi:MAG: dihydroneopterin aldolase [bacterium]|nr:dihydroneopterin aldolase [bacterium]